MKLLSFLYWFVLPGECTAGSKPLSNYLQEEVRVLQEQLGKGHRLTVVRWETIRVLRALKRAPNGYPELSWV